MGRATDEAIKVPELTEVKDLLLDGENYRLPEEDYGTRDQIKLLEIMDRDFDLVPIGQSIADNGYFPGEPLVAVREPSGKCIVVEGNRRLAALKLLTQPEMRKHSQYPDLWNELARTLRHDVSKVPVLIYTNRSEPMKVLGYRHIAGTLKWDPLAKAKFVAFLVERKGREANFKDIGRETGSHSNTIRDNYIAYRIYTQATDSFDIDTSRMPENFGVFFRALSSAQILRFIGLDKDRRPSQLKSPIPAGKRGRLEEIIGYIHGTKEIPPVLHDSRQLTQLGQILENREALANLRISRNLDEAFALAGGEETRLIESLQSASFHLDNALRDAHRHTRSLKVRELVKRCRDTMKEILEKFPSLAQLGESEQ